MTRALLALPALLLAQALPAGAQEVGFSPAVTEACLVRTFDSVGCVGVAAEHCIATLEAESNAGRGACYGRELEYWTQRLEDVHAALGAAAEAADAVLREDAAIPRQAPALAGLQAQWVAYRDAFCEFEAATWAGGSGTGPAVRQCLMTLTGMQVLLLEIGLELH